MLQLPELCRYFKALTARYSGLWPRVMIKVMVLLVKRRCQRLSLCRSESQFSFSECLLPVQMIQRLEAALNPSPGCCLVGSTVCLVVQEDAVGVAHRSPHSSTDQNPNPKDEGNEHSADSGWTSVVCGGCEAVLGMASQPDTTLHADEKVSKSDVGLRDSEIRTKGEVDNDTGLGSGDTKSPQREMAMGVDSASTPSSDTETIGNDTRTPAPKGNALHTDSDNQTPGNIGLAPTLMREVDTEDAAVVTLFKHRVSTAPDANHQSNAFGACRCAPKREFPRAVWGVSLVLPCNTGLGIFCFCTWPGGRSSVSPASRARCYMWVLCDPRQGCCALNENEFPRLYRE